MGCYAQRKNNNVVSPKTQQQTTPKKSQPKKNSSVSSAKQAQPKTPKQVSPSESVSGTIAGHDYVDLGLPSGILWAKYNIGANSPDGNGSYFAWGETTVNISYYEDKCAAYNKDELWLRRNGYIDIRGNLTMVHDVARVNWGSTWRMPTIYEIEELVENTIATWVVYNGVKGRILTSKQNGKSIFFPAAEGRVGSSIYNEESYGAFWSSTPCISEPNRANLLYFTSDDFDCSVSSRHFGLPVRPVSGENKFTSNDIYSNDDEVLVADTCVVHYYVDLGLPSGTKWATCNVGSINPEDHGDYYAWGETFTKSKYTENNSGTYNRHFYWLKNNGIIDSKGNLTTLYDAASYNWDSQWRLPTKEEVEELLNNTTAKWTTINGVKGQLLTSRRNGEQIFFPAGGFWRSANLISEPSIGSYWSSTPDANNVNYAYHFEFDSNNFSKGWHNRSYGLMVRPVLK